MYEGIGINWGNTLLGCVAALFIPMPFVFYFFGKKIRARSKFAPAPDIEQDKRRAAQRDEEGQVGGDAAEKEGSGSGSGSGSNEGGQQPQQQEMREEEREESEQREATVGDEKKNE